MASKTSSGLARSAFPASSRLSIDGALDLSGQLAGAITRTLYSNLDKIDARSVLWIDECHYATADDQVQHPAIIDAVLKKNPNAVVVGIERDASKRADKAQLHPMLMNAERYHVTHEAAMGCAIVPPKVTTPTTG